MEIQGITQSIQSYRRIDSFKSNNENSSTEKKPVQEDESNEGNTASTDTNKTGGVPFFEALKDLHQTLKNQKPENNTGDSDDDPVILPGSIRC